LELARAVEQLPGPRGMPGGSRYELKWDGYRMAGIRVAGGVRLWSRQGKDLTSRFPDVQAALEAQLEIDCVLDGEVVVWTGEKLDFGQLQLRLVTSPAKARRMVAERPASFVVFDVLSINGVDLRSQRWTTRRRRLDLLAENWVPPLQVSPVTDDPDEAREWLSAFGHTGVEGLVVKGAGSRYEPGRRSWVKVKTRETIDVICGAVTGSLLRPEVVIAGRYRGKVLEVVGRTVPLNDQQAAELAGLLKPAGARHPWPDEIGSGRWDGKNSKVPLVKVQPRVVIEVAADAARQGDHYRHPLRYLRPRADLEPGDVEQLP
jgi:ATP-dependent DNA ligase